jgi:diadenosine tetraphosphate (Ap4A) HIT family hydrolase
VAGDRHGVLAETAGRLACAEPKYLRPDLLWPEPALCDTRLVAGGTLIPQTVIRQGATWTMAVNRNQNLLGKTMLVLERPCPAVVDLLPTEWAELHGELRELARALERCFVPDHVNFAFLMNEGPQVHLHVIPRYQSERIWNGQVFEDPHWGSSFGSEQRLLGPDVLAELARQIRNEL